MTKYLLPVALFSVLVFSGVCAQEKLYRNTFPLADVVLLDGPFKHARDLNIQVLLKYEVDRLLAPYRKEAGLTPRADGFPNWSGLDGHVAGHYLSALSMNYAATKNDECRRRMEYMIAELKACQEANTAHHPAWGAGYVGGVPGSDRIWSTLKTGDLAAYRGAWAPWYNVHKMYAGLRDAWLYGGSGEAREMFIAFCDWGIAVTSSLSDSLMQSMLETEQGGIAEMFADAFQMTGESKYLTAARRFSHRVLLDAMAEGRDILDNKHANTQIPKVAGFERIAELTHDAHYGKAAGFFWETVTGNRSLAFGGNSRREFFPGAPACGDFVNDVEGPESCNSYNMLKLTEDLFRTAPLAKYADYYERTLYNHILSTQHPVHGGYVYFTPVRPRHYRVYSEPNEAMWCCVGTGMENHGKYNQFVYTHHDDSLFVNLFVATELTWREKGIALRQDTRFPYEEQTTLKVTRGSSRFTLMIRYPSWVKDGALKIAVNGIPAVCAGHPSSYVALDRAWQAGDVVQVMLPMHNTVEQLPNVPSYVALLHGPIVLAANAGSEDLAGVIASDGRWGHIPGGRRLPVDRAPIIISDNIAAITDGLERANDRPFAFTFPPVRMINPVNVLLEPFFQIHDARYMMYWMVLTAAQYRSYLDSIAALGKEKLALQERTIDGVSAGEQQPEVDHVMQSSNSHSGSSLDEFWRDAGNGGYFSYSLATNRETDVSLIVRYWGNEWGSRKFDISIDDEKLLTEDNTGRWNQSQFHEVTYAVPEPFVKGKDHIRVRFQALPDNAAGAVYRIRLVRKNNPSGMQ